MKNYRLFLGLALTISLLISCTGNQKILINNVVETEYGMVKGAVNENETVVTFKGIPYAAPPVGELRWNEPQPPASWEGVLDATEFCSSCIQLNNRRLPWSDEYMVSGEKSEDCLFLNIWTPAKSATDNLPVLVYIHGGAFREGSGSIEIYDGEELAKKGIVVVTINYRLGILGFMAHPWLTAESGHNASGNYGFMDQIAALKWIKSNISAFGGNSYKITVAGQSAGSRSVHQLTASPLAKGLINGAVTLSGASMSPVSGPLSGYGAGRITTGFISSDTALNRGIRIAGKLGVTNLEELRAVPAENLIGDFAPSIDGYVLTKNIATIFEEGNQNDVPAIAGLVADETSSTAGYGISTVSEFETNAQKTYGASASEFLSLYPVKSDEEAGMMSKVAKREKGRFEVYEWASFRAKTAKTPAYTFYFSRGIPWPEHLEFAAFHSGDIPYWFNNLKILDRPWTKTDTLVAETTSSYLVNFVKNGDPNGDGLPLWPSFDENKKETMDIGDKITVIPVATDEKMNFFKGK